MKIILDAMGGDNAPREIIKGAAQALQKYEDVEIIFTGNRDIILQELSQYDYNKDRVEVIHAPGRIEMAEPPVEAIKRKKDSSLVVGLNLLAQKQGDVFITAGSTGATIAGAMLIVRRIKGVKRPALAPVLPTMKGGVLLIDCGANVDCKPSYLAQFGVMGSIYMKDRVRRGEPQGGACQQRRGGGKGKRPHQSGVRAFAESSGKFRRQYRGALYPER